MALPPTAAAPYLSIVVAARNDDHGGDLRGRMQLFLDGLLDQCDRFNLTAELIIVEWNPPPAPRPRLVDALQWPASRRTNGLDVRLIEVSPALHARFAHAAALPLFQMIAKNVGIRRARGQFVLATNVDILFADELIIFLAQGDLDARRMYRVDRLDVPADVPRGRDVGARLQWCAQHVLRFNVRDHTLNLATGAVHRIYKPHTPESLEQERRVEAGEIAPTTHHRLHTNACGDFTLLHRDRWHELRGYPEMAMYSMHLDSVLCHAAHVGGALEMVLPHPLVIYHIEHAPGSGFTPEAQDQLDARLARAAVPQLAHATFAQWALDMRRNKMPCIFNDMDWGLADDRLPQMTVVERGGGPIRAAAS
jgi:hypothetical protein